MTNKLAIHFSSKKMDWGTPQDFFDKLNERFRFTLDPCASDENHKCYQYYTKEQNGLVRSWQGHTVFMNPPYGKPENACKPNCRKKKCVERGYHVDTYQHGINDWMEKAYAEWLKGDCTIVCLVPARTDTRWFHDFVYEPMKRANPFVAPSIKLEFIKGKLKFEGAKHSAPFPSMLVIYNKQE